ncbi:MAG: SIS domain-containing protein [Acaryochloridaceae cyanobacterium RL_2_7]|nr:SIS domain-containing protein [Acaryochloridaceae cyanobacterium RL_2_7]
MVAPSKRTHLAHGDGASDSALWPLWFRLNQRGILAQKIETSELIHYLPNRLEGTGLCVTISQSGESIEIRRLVEKIQALRAQGKPCKTLVSITTAPGNTLSIGSDLTLHTQAGAEVGVATKTFTSTLAFLHLLGTCLLGDSLEESYGAIAEVAEAQQQILEHWKNWIEPAAILMDKVKTYALVGRGPTQAAVDDGALVLKESLRMMAHGFSGGEFRHGPMEMLNSALGVLIFTTPGSTLELSQRLSRDVEQRGGCLVTIGQRVEGLGSCHLDLPTVDQALMPMLEILPVQLIAHHVSQVLGLVPGNFQWSGKVVLQE